MSMYKLSVVNSILGGYIMELCFDQLDQLDCVTCVLCTCAVIITQKRSKKHCSVFISDHIRVETVCVM